MANEYNDLKRILSLVLIAIPAIASVNINCNGKAFHCVNSTHFMICVDLGGGLSTTIDDFVIPCPATTVCQGHNIFECEFPKIEETLPLHVIGVEKQSDISETTLVTNSVTDPTPTSDTVSVFNDTILTTATPKEDLVPNETVVETTGANNDNTTVINFQITSNLNGGANEINDKQSNNPPNNSLRRIFASDKNNSYEIDVTNSSLTDNSKSADNATVTVECIISKPTTDLSSVRTVPTTDVFTYSDTLDLNNSTTDKLNKASQIISNDVAILSSEVNATVVNTNNKTNIQTDLAIQNLTISNTEESTTKRLLVDNHANITTQYADVLISLDALHQNITKILDPPRDSIASNVNNSKTDNLTENKSASKTVIFSGRPIVDTKVNIARTTVTNDEIDYQNTTNSPLDIINTVHSRVAENNYLPSEYIPADSNTQTTDNGFAYVDSPYIASTTPPIDVSNSQYELNKNITLIDIPNTVLNKPLSEMDTVNLTLDKNYYIPESVILPPIIRNTSIDDNPHTTLRVGEQSVESIPNTTLPNNKFNSISSLKDNNDLLIDQKPKLDIPKNEKVDISKEKGISNIHVFVDEVINTVTSNTLNNNDNKNVQNFNTENKNFNDGELKSETENLTSVMSDEFATVNGVVASSQITNTDKTVVPLVDQINTNGTQSVITTSSPIDISAFQNKLLENLTSIHAPITVLNKNLLETEIVNLTLDKNDFVPKYVTTKNSTNNDTSILRAGEITVFESEPSTTPLTNDINVFGSSKHKSNIPISQKPEFETEIKYLNNRELKDNTEHSTSVVPTNTVNGVVPSIQITEIDTSTVQNVPIVTTNTVLAPNDNSVDNFATPFSLIAKPEILHSDVVDDINVESSIITNKQIIKENNSVNLIPTSIDLVSEPVAVGASIQTESNKMAFPLRIDQLNATFIPNVEITTVPIDYTGNINRTDYILQSEIVKPTTDTNSVLLAVELDSTNTQNVPHATPRALALTPRETSGLDIQANPNILTKPVTSERSVLTTKPVGIVPIEIDNVKEHVTPVSNDFTMKFAPKNLDILPNRGSSIITDIVEINPIKTEAVLTTPSLNEIAYTNNFHATADETVTQNPIQDSVKNLLEKPIEPMEIGASEVVDTSLKINNKIEPNSKTNSINIFELGTNVEHLVPLKTEFVSDTVTVHPDVITKTEENVSSDIITVSAQDPLISPINVVTNSKDNISEKPIPSTEHFLMTANSIPSTVNRVVDENVIDQPMLLMENISKKVPVTNEVNEPIVVNLLSTADKTINKTMNDQILSGLKSTIENYSQNILTPEYSTDYLTPTQILPSEILTTIGVPQTGSSTIDEVTKLKTMYNAMVNNIPKKSEPDNIAITASTQPFTGVTSATVNNIVATMDHVPQLLSVVSNMVDNEKNQSSVLLKGTSIPTPAIADEVIMSSAVDKQKSTDSTVINAFSDINLGELNVSGVNNSQTNLVAENNNTYLISKIKLTELLQSMPNTLSVKGSIDNMDTTIGQESEPLIIKTDNGNGTINTVLLMDTISKNNNNMQHPFVAQNLPQQNTINENNSQNILESGNIGDHVSPTISDFIAESNIVQSNLPLNMNLVPLGLKELNLSYSQNPQMTNSAITYNDDNIAEKSTPSPEHFPITGNLLPSTESSVVDENLTGEKMLLAENILKNVPVITNDVNEPIVVDLQSIADKVPDNSTEHLNPTQIFPSDILTTIGVPHTDSSMIDEATKLETSYNEMVYNTPEKSQPENIAITASTQPFPNVKSAMVNNIVATMDQVPELLTVVRNIVDNEKNQSSVLIEGTPVQTPAIIDEVNTSTAVNIQLNTNNTGNTVLNALSDIILGELNVSGVNNSQNNLVAENSTKYLTSTQILPSEILTTIGVPHADPNTIDEVTKLVTSYKEMVNNIPEKSPPENIAITASTQPFTDVTSAMGNNIVATMDQVPELLTVVSNIVDNEKNKSSVLIEGTSIQTPAIADEVIMSSAVDKQKSTDSTVLNAFSDIILGEMNVSGVNNSQNNLVAENSTEYLTSTQILPSEILTNIGVPQTDSNTIDEVTKLVTSYNEMVNNIPEKSPPENIAITASTKPFTDVTSAMGNNIVATMDQVPELLTVVSNIVDNEKNKSSVLIEGTSIQTPAIADEVIMSSAVDEQKSTDSTVINAFSDINLGELNVSGVNNSQNNLVAENNNTYLISTIKLTELLHSMPNTLSVKGSIDNMDTKIGQESEPFIIKTDKGNGTINTVVLMDTIPKINNNMQHLFVEQKLPQQNTINENNSQNILESGNNGNHVSPTISDFIAESNIVQSNTPLSMNLVPLGLKELNLSHSQNIPMTNSVTTYNVDNISEKSTPPPEHFLITANLRPSTESSVIDENVSKKVHVISNEGNEPIVVESLSTTEKVPDNSTEHLTPTQIFPSEILTAIGVPHTDSSMIDEVIKLETSYNEMVNNIPEKSPPENIAITASTQPFTDVTSAMVNNIVATMDQVPELLTVVRNIVDNEKNQSSVLIEGTPVQTPAIIDEVNTSTAVNIQLNTNNAGNTVLNALSDIILGELNVSGVNNSQNNLVAENNNTYLISKIKLTELSQNMPNILSAKGSTDNVVTTIDQESEPFIIKTDNGNGTINTVILMEKYPKNHNNMQHLFAEQKTYNGQNNLESGNNGDHVGATMNDFISEFKIVPNLSQSSLGTNFVPQKLEEFLSDSMLNHTVVNISSDNNPQSVLINVVPGNISIITDNVTTTPDYFSLPVTAHLDHDTVTPVTQTDKSNYANSASPVEMYHSIINSIEKRINSFNGQNINGENHETSGLLPDTENSLKLELLTMDSKKLSGTDLDVDNINYFIDNTSTAINHDMVTQNILNMPLSKDESNEPIATERNHIPDTTIMKKISYFNCTTSGTKDVGTLQAPSDKMFTESGKITNIATSAITSKDNIPSDSKDGNAVDSQPLQITATGSPMLSTIPTNYDTTSIPPIGQSIDTFVVADLANNKPTGIQNTKTVANNLIIDITSETKSKSTIGSNNSGSSLDVNTTPHSPETSFISLPTTVGNVAAAPMHNVQEIITMHTPIHLIDRENKTIVSVKQLDNLDSINFGSNSNVDTWKSTGQIIVQSNINSPTSTIVQKSTLNNLKNPQSVNTFSGSEHAQTTLTKAISSHYNLGAITNPKTGTDDVKTTNPSLTDNSEIFNIQKPSTPDYTIKTTIQNLDTLKQLNTPSTVTVIENTFAPTVDTLTKQLIQNKINSIISDQKSISAKQNSDKRIPTVNPTASVHDSNTDEKIKIVSTYNTVNSLNTMPTATLQLSSPSISNYYVEDTRQTKSPSVSVTTNDFDLQKTSIKEYIKNLAKRLHIVPAVESKHGTSNILSTSGINTTSNRDITFTTTLLSNSFDRENLTQPYYITKKIVNDATPNNVFTINSKNIPYSLLTDLLKSRGFKSGSTLPADSLSKVVVYGQNTATKSLISESPVLKTKVNNIPKIVLDRMKQFSTSNPFVTSGSGPIQRFVIKSNTQVPQLVNLIKSKLSSPQYIISNVNKDPLVIADSNIQSIIKSPKSDSRLETIIFTREKATEPYVVSKISKGFRRSYDDSKDDNNVTSVQNVDSDKKNIGSILNNNTQDTDPNSIKLVGMNEADTVNYYLESGGKGSKNNVESTKIEEKEPTENKSISKDSNKPIDIQFRTQIGTKYLPGPIESVALQGNSQKEALKQKYHVRPNLENKTDNDSVNIAKRNSTINDNLDLTSTNHTVTAYVQSYLNKDGKQGNKTSDVLRLPESSVRRANTANEQLNASSKVTSTGTESPPAFNCTARGRYADKKDCRKFYTCIGNLQPIKGTCPNNTVFSEINKQCTRNLSHCVRNNQFRCLLEGRFSDFFKDNVYYICVKNCTNHFTRYKLQCQDGYHLNKESVKCERDEEVSTQSASSVSEVSNDETTTPKTKSEKTKSFDDFECEKEGNFPYANDCRKYYTCTKVKDVYRRKIKKCSKDEVYDKKKKKCVDSDSREC